MNTPFRLKAILTILALSSMVFHLYPATAASATEVLTCIDLNSGKERIAKAGTCRASSEAMAKWHLAPTDSAFASGGATKTINICSNKKSSSAPYQIIRNSCYRHMQTNLYTRSSALPAKPVITGVSSLSSESASLSLASDLNSNVDAPIAYYTITSSKGDVKKVSSWRDLTITVSGLQSSTSYTFTISATSVDGTSSISGISLPVTTQRYVAPVVASTSAPLAVPAFTLSADAESTTVDTAATGFTISSSGGAIASFTINATPAGMSFNTTTGALSGTPSTVAVATLYTLTATNATGSATRTFTLTVIAAAVVYAIGDIGPGGGRIFYVASTSFVCGPTLNLNCKYMEAAPTSGTNSWTDASYAWSGVTTPAIVTSSSAIGSGYKNTLAMIDQSSTALRAGTVSQAYRGPNNLTDWYLPSKDELNQMCKWQRGVAWTSDATVCSGGTSNSGPGAAGFVSVGFLINYWSSTQDAGSAFSAWYQWFDLGNQGDGGGKVNSWNVRPIRAF